jgi:hypothetical protein
MKLPILVLLAVLAAAPSAQSDDPFVGVWALNLQKSEFPGPPPERPYLVSFEENGDGTILGVVFRLDEAGNRVAGGRIVFRYDGMDYEERDSVTGAAAGNVLAFTRTDARTVEVIHKLNGGTRQFSETRRISADGLTMTFVMTATDALGRTRAVVQVFDRQ